MSFETVTEINPREAEAVRLIFKMTSEGYGYGQIIDKLNLLGYKTKNGVPFGKNSIYEILRNERYKGIYVYNKRSSSRSSDGKRNNHDFKASEDIIRIPGGCPAIVSEELWNKANATRIITGKYTNNAKHPYLLTGFMYCDKCGYAMQGNVRKLKGKIKTTYRCSARYNKRTCNCKEIKASIVDDFVLSTIFDTYFTEDAIDRLTDKLNEIKQQMLSDDETLNKVKEELQNDIKLRDSLIDVLLETNNNPAVAERLNSTEKSITKKKEFIEQFENQIVSMFTPEDIKNSIDSIKTYMKTEKNNEQIKNMLSNFIDKILIGDDTIKLFLKVIPPEDKTESLSSHANKIEPKDMEITSLHLSMVVSRVGAETAQYFGEGPRINKIPNFKSR